MVHLTKAAAQAWRNCKPGLGPCQAVPKARLGSAYVGLGSAGPRLQARPGTSLLNGFTILALQLNVKLDFWFSPAPELNLCPNLGPVHPSSGPNRSSGPNFGIPMQYIVDKQGNPVDGH